MLRRLIAFATIVAPVACAGVLGLDPGTLRDGADAEGGADGGAGAEDATPVEIDAATRGCAKALAAGYYCDDFDEEGRTDPNARTAKDPNDSGDKLTLVSDVFKSSPRSLKATYLNTGFPQAYLQMPWTVAGNTFHMTMAIRVARAGVTFGDAFAVAELFEVPGRDGIAYTIELTPRQEAVEVRLTEANLVRVRHHKTIPYDEWHVISIRYAGRYAYLQIDDESVSEGTSELGGDYTASFGLEAFAPVTVWLDDVEIGP